ncbi:MAG: superoxide dismutase [Lentisphaeria bacterium]|nr:superoxide dismutase [Lentisphaeria bacterium]
MAHSVKDLPYAFDALEPHIDAKTMEIHHDKHHVAYCTKLNAALEGTGKEDACVCGLLKDLASLPAGIQGAVRNNGGGFVNHNLFWEILSPNGGGQPSGELAEAINSAFGSFEEFQAKFANAAATQFGSGWAWLVVKEDGTLDVYGTPNQDNPVMNGDKAILGLDVWEHAYYLNYQNRRPDYISAFWNVVNWDAVAAKFADDYHN